MLSQGRIWLALHRHWIVLGLVAFVVLLAVADPDGLGVGRWIAIALGGVAIVLGLVYALTRFVVWAGRQR